MIGPLVVLAALVLLVGASSFSAVGTFRERYEYLLPARDALRFPDTTEDSEQILLRLSPDIDALMSSRGVLEEHRLSVFRDVPTFCSSDGRECVTLAGIEPESGRFEQGATVNVSLDWLVGDDAEPGVQYRVRVLHDSWLPGRRAVPVVASTYRLVETAPAPASPAGGFHAILPLVLGDYSTMPHLHLLTLPAALTLPADAPTGRAGVILEVFDEDGQQWRTSSGGVSVSLFVLTITEAER